MLNSKFWNNIEYSAQDWADYFDNLYTPGIVPKPDSFGNMTPMKVTPASGLKVRVADGSAFIKGYNASVAGGEVLTLVGNGEAVVRRDMVVLRLDIDASRITLDIKKGSVSLVRDNSIYEVPLAIVTIKPGASEIYESDIEDIREYCNIHLFPNSYGRLQSFAVDFSLDSDKLDIDIWHEIGRVDISSPNADYNRIHMDIITYGGSRSSLQRSSICTADYFIKEGKLLGVSHMDNTKGAHETFSTKQVEAFGYPCIMIQAEPITGYPSYSYAYIRSVYEYGVIKFYMLFDRKYIHMHFSGTINGYITT